MVMHVRRLTIIATLLVAALFVAASAKAAEASHPGVSFLVSVANPIREVSVGDLRRIFLGEISRWRNGHRIILFVRPAETPEGRVFLERLVQMSDIDYSQWWLGAVFRGRAANAPTVIASTVGMARTIANTPDAIGFVITPAGTPESGVATLTVEGKTPSDPTYPVRVR